MRLFGTFAAAPGGSPRGRGPAAFKLEPRGKLQLAAAAVLVFIFLLLVLLQPPVSHCLLGRGEGSWAGGGGGVGGVVGVASVAAGVSSRHGGQGPLSSSSSSRRKPRVLEYGVEVLGMDLSRNMVELALERAQKEPGSLVQFEIGNATRRTFPEGSFDIIYSRDTILHVEGKSTLFGRFLSWLKPGGQLLISDYCCGPRPWSKMFTDYVQQRGYSLLTPHEYGQMLKDTGFVQVQALDRTGRMVSALTQELQQLERSRKEFIQEFSEMEFESMASGWREKLQRCADGDQRWGVFCGLKPN